MRVERACTSLKAKGFTEKGKRDHYCFFFWHRGKKTAIRTKFSHGQQIGVYVLRKMCDQLRLADLEQLDRLLSCDMGAEEYLAYLTNTGVLPSP